MRSERHHRAGWTLLELLVVIACATIMLGFTAALMAQLMRVDKSARARVVASASLERLARDLRNDARVATGPADVSKLRLVLPEPEGRTVEYSIRAVDVLRSVQKGGKTLAFDAYKRPVGTLARFETGRDDSRTILVLTLGLDPEARPGRAGDPAYRDYRIEAVPGRDIRLTQGVTP